MNVVGQSSPELEQRRYGYRGQEQASRLLAADAKVKALSASSRATFVTHRSKQGSTRGSGSNDHAGRSRVQRMTLLFCSARVTEVARLW